MLSRSLATRYKSGCSRDGSSACGILVAQSSETRPGKVFACSVDRHVELRNRTGLQMRLARRTRSLSSLRSSPRWPETGLPRPASLAILHNPLQNISLVALMKRLGQCDIFSRSKTLRRRQREYGEYGSGINQAQG